MARRTRTTRQAIQRIAKVADPRPGALPLDRPRASAGYLRDITTPVLSSWQVALREPIDDIASKWIEAAAKAIDQLHNSGWLSGGVDQAVAQMCGNGLTLNLKPKLGVIGDQKATETWARDVEQRFWTYANHPWSVDAGGRYSLGQLAAHGVKQYYATGEIVAAMPFIERPGSSHGSKVRLLPSSRIAQGGGTVPNVQGVILGKGGEAVGYMIENRDPMTNHWEVKRVEARTRTGRISLMHLMDAAPTAVRGITPLVPALRVIRQIDQLADATLTSALIKAIVAATVESDAPTSEILQMLRDADEDETEAAPGDMDRLMMRRQQWYSKASFDMAKVAKVLHLFPGEKLSLHTTAATSDTYADFMRSLLREVARCLCITYEQLTGDYTGATYSSVRMAIADMWLINIYRRAYLPAKFHQQAFENWLEEDIMLGNTVLPGGIQQFYVERQNLVMADWRGPPKPTADDLKTAKAQQIQRAEGWVPREQLAAEYGNDWRDVDDAQKRETENRKALGLDPMPTVGGGGNEAGRPGEGGSAGEGSGGGASRDGPERAAALDAQLTGALMRGDDAAVEAILEES